MAAHLGRNAERCPLQLQHIQEKFKEGLWEETKARKRYFHRENLLGRVSISPQNVSQEAELRSRL